MHERYVEGFRKALALSRFAGAADADKRDSPTSLEWHRKVFGQELQECLVRIGTQVAQQVRNQDFFGRVSLPHSQKIGNVGA